VRRRRVQTRRLHDPLSGAIVVGIFQSLVVLMYTTVKRGFTQLMLAKASNVLHTLVLREEDVLRRRPRTQALLEGSRKRFGSEFHVDGPATANARPPYVTRRCGGTVS